MTMAMTLTMTMTMTMTMIMIWIDIMRRRIIVNDHIGYHDHNYEFLYRVDGTVYPS